MNKVEEDQLRCIAQLVDGATLLKAGRSVSGVHVAELARQLSRMLWHT